MPVPSTIVELRLTMVGTPKGWLARAQNFIMIAGPTAQMRAIDRSASSISFSGSGVRALRP